ncbi:MAG: DnaB-like helicase C-terminal domain-containing protein [Candidatus Bathyarchaeota archaeon]
MTTEQQIIWLSWYRNSECCELFEQISPEMFHTEEAAEAYRQIKIGLDYHPKKLDKLLYLLDKIGILALEDTWLPIRIDYLKEALIDEWKQAKGNAVLNKAHEALNQGGDYKHALKEFDDIETKHEKSQSRLADHFEEIANDYANETTKGFPTGISELDRVTKQFQDGHFWVIAGATNMGKTTLTLQMVKRAILAKKKVEFISLEMSAKQLLERITWLHATENKIKFEQAIGELIDLPFTVTENIRTVDKLRSHLENTEAEIVVVDYIQLVRGGKSYYDEATATSNLLQEMAIKKMIPIIGLSQVTKESYKGGAKNIMDFKGSGAIAESADVAIEIYREIGENAPPIVDVKLLLKKNRHGPAGGNIKGVQFDNKRGYFVF